MTEQNLSAILDQGAERLAAGDVAGYWALMAPFDPYVKLAGAVAANRGFLGFYANSHFQNVATSVRGAPIDGVELTIIQRKLATQDLELRRTSLTVEGNITLSSRNSIDYHTTVFFEHGLPPTAYTPYIWQRVAGPLWSAIGGTEDLTVTNVLGAMVARVGGAMLLQRLDPRGYERLIGEEGLMWSNLWSAAKEYSVQQGQSLIQPLQEYFSGANASVSVLGEGHLRVGTSIGGETYLVDVNIHPFVGSPEAANATISYTHEKASGNVSERQSIDLSTGIVTEERSTAPGITLRTIFRKSADGQYRADQRTPDRPASAPIPKTGGIMDAADASRAADEVKPVPLSIDAPLADTDARETLSVSLPGIGDAETLPMSKRLTAEAESLIASADYWSDPQKQARSAQLFKEIVRHEESEAKQSANEADAATAGFGLELSGLLDPFPFAGDPLAKTLSKDDLEAEADDLIGADDYWDNPHKQHRVAAIFKTLYPGTVRTAPLDFGEGAVGAVISAHAFSR
jgi:hypothetical protein